MWVPVRGGGRRGEGAGGCAGGAWPPVIAGKGGEGPLRKGTVRTR